MTYGDQSKQRLGPNVVCVEGMYENNQLDGPGSITYTSGEVLYCMFTAGYIQGPAKLFHHSKEGLHQLKMVIEKSQCENNLSEAGLIRQFYSAVLIFFSRFGISNFFLLFALRLVGTAKESDMDWSGTSQSVEDF